MIRVNLLPVREARRKAGVRQQMMMLAAAAIGAVVLAGAIHTWTKASISAAQQRARNLQTQLEQFKPQQAKVEAFKAKKAEIEQKLTVIERLDRSRSGPVHIMDELAMRIPDRVWLTELRADGGRLQLAGMSLDNELVASFLTALNDSLYFANVELQGTELKEVDKLKLNLFEITAQLESPEEPATDAPAATPAAATAPRSAARPSTGL